MDTHYIEEEVPGGVQLKMWTRGVPVEDEAERVCVCVCVRG